MKTSVFSPLSADQILDWSNLKQIADDFLKRIQSEKEVPYTVENIVRKGEIACYKQFLHFSQCFPHLYIFSVPKCGIVRLRVNKVEFIMRKGKYVFLWDSLGFYNKGLEALGKKAF